MNRYEILVLNEDCIWIGLGFNDLTLKHKVDV